MPNIKQTRLRDPLTVAGVRSWLRARFVLVVQSAAILLIAGAAEAAGGGGDDHDVVMEAVWQGVNLALIVGVIIYFGRGPISEFFSSRRDGIKTELSDAAELLTQAEQRNAELQRRLVDLSSEIEEISERASRRAGEEAERILAEARTTAERIRRDAQAAVDQELRRAQAELRNEAADLALDLAANKLAANVSDADRDRLMDEFIVRVEPSASSVDTTPEGAN
jgi:F-type H+-transporting ATPase subunit b